MDKIQINEFDVLAFCTDVFYIAIAIFFALRFAHHLTLLRLKIILSNLQDSSNGFILISYIASIMLIMSAILSNGHHESLFDQIIMTCGYIGLSIIVLLFRKFICLCNTANYFDQSTDNDLKVIAKLYEAGSLISSAILLSGAVICFYELHLLDVFLLCIAAAFFLEGLMRVILSVRSYFINYSLKQAFLDNNIYCILQYVFTKIHIALILFIAAKMIDLNTEFIFEILSSWLFLALILLVVVFLILLLLEKIIFQNNLKIFYIAKDFSDLLKYLLCLFIDIAMIILLN